MNDDKDEIAQTLDKYFKIGNQNKKQILKLTLDDRLKLIDELEELLKKK